MLGFMLAVFGGVILPLLTNFAEDLRIKVRIQRCTSQFDPSSSWSSHSRPISLVMPKRWVLNLSINKCITSRVIYNFAEEIKFCWKLLLEQKNYRIYGLILRKLFLQYRWEWCWIFYRRMVWICFKLQKKAFPMIISKITSYGTFTIRMRMR